jgi:dihydroorotase
MIDPHVHLRDWNESHKMTLERGLILYQIQGFSHIFEMPNTKPAIISKTLALKRIEDANRAIEKNGLLIKHGLYIGLTNQPAQIKEAVDTYQELFPRVVGLKLYCAGTTGDLKVTDNNSQYNLLKQLSELKYNGVLAVHCEDEGRFYPEKWNPLIPSSHDLQRPSISELRCVRNILYLSKKSDFKGKLHICHVSNPNSINEIESAKNHSDFKITCGITPHHAIYNKEYMDSLNTKDALLLRVNPPIRDRKNQEQLFQSILDGKVDFIETDFAPHTLEEKINPEINNPYASGIADLSLYHRLLELLKTQGILPSEIFRLTHYNIVKTFGLEGLI